MAAKASSAMLEAAAERDRVWLVEREVTCGGEGERNELLFDLWQLSHEVHSKILHDHAQTTLVLVCRDEVYT